MGGQSERSCFDVIIFNPQINPYILLIDASHDNKKRREYQQHIHKAENASFTSLIGMDDAATQVCT